MPIYTDNNAVDYDKIFRKERNRMSLYKSGEDYLETILILHNRTGFVRSVDIATELGYSKPSISRAMVILKNDGFITVGDGGQIKLTEKGLEKAESVYERHRVIRCFLGDILGASAEAADEDACKIEHVISEDSFARLKSFVLEQTHLEKI